MRVLRGVLGDLGSMPASCAWAACLAFWCFMFCPQVLTFYLAIGASGNEKWNERGDSLTKETTSWMFFFSGSFLFSFPAYRILSPPRNYLRLSVRSGETYLAACFRHAFRTPDANSSTSISLRKCGAFPMVSKRTDHLTQFLIPLFSTQRLLGLSMEDQTLPLDTPVFGGLKTLLFEGPKIHWERLGSKLGPPVVPFYPFLGEGSPTKTDYRKKGTLIPTSKNWRT